MEKETIAEILELIGSAREFKPIVELGIEALKEYLPYLDELYSGLLDYQIEKTVYAIERYKELGCSAESAVLLVLNSRVALQDAMSKVGYSGCGKNGSGR